MYSQTKTFGTIYNKQLCYQFDKNLVRIIILSLIGQFLLVLLLTPLSLFFFCFKNYMMKILYPSTLQEMLI